MPGSTTQRISVAIAASALTFVMSACGGNNGVAGSNNGANNGGSNNGTTAGSNNGTTGGSNNGASNNGTTGGSNNGTTGGSNNGASNNGTTGGSNNGTTGGSNNGTTGGSNNGTTGGSNNGMACTDLDPALGPCDPLCQSGCMPDEHCVIDGPPLEASCGTAGTGTQGAACTEHADCGVGLHCRTVGGANRRCIEFCAPGGDDCPTNHDCIAYNGEPRLGVCIPQM